MRGFKKVIALTMVAALMYSSVGEVKAYSLLKEKSIAMNDEATDIKDFKYEVVEDKVTIIGYEGISEKIIIPEKINDIKVVAIKAEAFKESKLKEVEMPFIEIIEERAFLDCSLLEKIEVSNKVTVKEESFNGSNINTITINYKDEDISKINIEEFNEIISKIEGVDTSKVNGRFVKNNEYTRNLNDTEPPVMKLNGEKEVTIEAGQKYEELGAIGEDAIDGRIKAIVQGEVNINKPGVYNVTYTAEDSSGNSASITRKVTVVDTTAPEITLNGEKEITIEGGNKYEESGVTVKDIVDGKVELKINGEVDTKKVGEYKVTYTATDAAGNKASVVRTVKVIDTTRPIIIFNGEKEIIIEALSKYTELGASGKDIVDGAVEVKIVPEINVNKVGEYVVSYYAADKAGNKASAIRRIYVKDTVAPVLSLNGDSKVKLEVGDRYVEENADAKDAVDGQISVAIEGNVDTSKAGEYTVKYTATDNSKNTSTVTRTIQVEEKKVIEEDKDNDSDEDKNNNGNEIITENNNDLFIAIGVIGGILAVIGLTALGFTYYKKNKK